MNKKLILEINSNKNSHSINFTTVAKSTIYLDRFKRKVKRITFKLKHNFNEFSDLFTVNNEINDFFQNLVENLTEEAKDDDLISVCIGNKEMTKPIYIPSKKKINFNTKLIFDRIEKFSQSFRDFLFDGELEFEIFITENIFGRGFKSNKKSPKSLTELSHNKRSVIKIHNNDNSCGLRALYVSKYFFENSRDENWDRVIKNRFNMQVNGAKYLAKLAQINMSEPISRESWDRIQKSIENYQIRIIDARNKKNLIFDGPRQDKRLYIEYNDDHYNSIINIKGYMGKRFYCHYCHIAFDKIIKHKCQNICSKCFDKCDNSVINKLFCEDCFINFKNITCFDNHIKNHICKFIKKCSKCKLKYKFYHGHKCF